MKSRKAQVAIFVIIAIVLIAGIATLFVFRDRIFPKAVPSDLVPIYDYYQSCIEASVIDGISLLGSQAGHIDLPDFEAGTEYAPFSSQLGHLGMAIPYWYYVSGNGIIKEQVPTKMEMQRQLANYIEERLDECDFNAFLRQGYDVKLGEANVKAEIKDNEVLVNVNQPLSIDKIGEEEARTFVINNHKLDIDSRFGGFYNLAREIYDYEKREMFLEDYALDVLHLYAPVAGTEITCSPLIWNPYQVIDDLRLGLEANMQMIKIQGDYYSLNEKMDNYYIVDPGFALGSNEQVSFIYDPDWASRFEIWPTENNLMMAEPIGPREGISALGFCYASYKFVYDMYFPVLVQIYNPDDAEQIFQFPVALVVTKNQAREALETEMIETEESICTNANTEINVYTYDIHLSPIEADIKYKCLLDVCNLGKTQITDADAMLTADVPQCVNAILIANAPGYKEELHYISTNEDTIADIVLDKEYNLSLQVFVDDKLSTDLATLAISENLENDTELAGTISYPLIKDVKLAEGDYNFDLKVYTQQPFTLPEVEQRECVDVPRKGVLGILGLTDEECFDYTIPSQTVDYMVYAGGSQDHYITQSELERNKIIRIYATSVEPPSNIEQLQATYDLIEGKDLWIELS